MHLKSFFILSCAAFIGTSYPHYSFAQDNPTSEHNGQPAIGALSTEQAKSFVTETGNKIIQILANKQKPLHARKEDFRDLLKENFNISAIGRFVLGKYWKQANEDQKQQYLKLFEDAIVESYSAQFNNYSNEELKILDAGITNKGGILVKSDVLRPHGGEPLRVDWQIFKTKDGIKVHDIIVNGVSMSITQRSEYAAIIQSTGQGIEGLLNTLRQKPVVTNPSASK